MSFLQLQSATGIVAIILLACLLSENRRACFSWRLVLAALGLQFTIAVVMLQVPAARGVLYSLNSVVTAISAATKSGTSFVFGYVGGGTPPFPVTQAQNLGSLAFEILPLLLVISALSALLWHWRILPLVVRAFAYALEKTLAIGGAVGLGSASTVFLGMVEAPLLIRPYLQKISRSELFLLITVGLSTVAGTVMVVYASVLQPVIPGALGHILVASFISLPGGILIAKLMIPDETATPATVHIPVNYRSSMDAIARGTEDGLKLYLSIIAMLIVMVSLVALADAITSQLPHVNGAPVTVERVFGWLFWPLVWLYGIPQAEASDAAALLGTKTILNEFIAYLKLAALPQGVLSPRSRLIMLYAMCGFANLGSVGIMIAGMSGLVPERRSEIVQLSLRGLISGTLASGMTGAIVGTLPAFAL